MSTTLTTGEIMLVALAAVLVPMIVLWAISLFTHDVSIVDIFWGPGFAIVAWVTFLAGPGHGFHPWLVVTLTTLWGLRLALYLAWRNRGQGEDYRYQAMRKRIGPRFRWLSLALVFFLQAVLMWVVSLPVQLGQLGRIPQHPTLMHGIGMALWLTGMFFETVGDLQLARFKADPKHQGQVMDRGLWRYTRHPNYFGNALIWWGFFLTAASVGAWWTVVSPLLMTLLLLKVSGVALLEKDIGERRPAYRDYIRRTNAFIPGPPRHQPAAHASGEVRR